MFNVNIDDLKRGELTKQLISKQNNDKNTSAAQGKLQTLQNAFLFHLVGFSLCEMFTILFPPAVVDVRGDS